MPTVATPVNVDVSRLNGGVSQLTISPRFLTGRQADSVRYQFTRDLTEGRAARNDGTRSEFQDIIATFDAYRFSPLFHTHRLVIERY
jgi:hypothetical protein